MTDNSQDLDQIPEDEDMELEAPAAKKAMLSPTQKLLLVSVSALTIMGTAIFYTAAQQEGSSSTPRGAALDATPGGAIQQESEVYRESVAEANRQRADRASQLGATSVPTPEVIMMPLVELDRIDGAEDVDAAAEEVDQKEVVKPEVVKRRVLPQAPAAEPVVRKRISPTKNDQPVAQVQSSRTDEEEEENPYLSSISSQMGQFARTFEPKPMGDFSISAPSTDEEDAGALTAASATAAADGDAQEQPMRVILRPGDVLYAETLNSVSSDLESPVLVEIVSGELKGARLVGSYTTDDNSDRMVVVFENMTLTDGTVLSVSAYAVDGESAETAVRSDVHRRYVARYAPIIAASLITGYASAKAQPQQTVIGTGDNAQVVYESSTEEESLYAGVANAADAISEDILANSPDGPKVVLRDGFPLGIIFVSAVEAPAE